MCVAKIPVFFVRSTPLYCINYYFCTIGNLKKSNHEKTRMIDFLDAYFFMRNLDSQDNILFSDYERHFANIQETLASLIAKASNELGDLSVSPVITGSGGLTLAKHLEVPFTQEVIAVSTALTHYAPQTDVAIELGGEDAKIIYFEGGNVEQRMNGICAGGTGSYLIRKHLLDQGCHLINERTCTAGTDTVHTLFDITAFKIDDLGIFSAELDCNIGLWRIMSESSGYCNNLLRKRNLQMLCKGQSA